MRTRLLLSACIALLSLTGQAQAAAQPVTQQQQAATATSPATARGSLPSDANKVPPQPTEDQIAEANDVRSECERGKLKDMYDCNCMALTVLTLRAEESVKSSIVADIGIIKDKARKTCANKVNLAGKSYSRCLSWAPKRMTDYEPFCACFATAYSNHFAKNPVSNTLAHKYLIKAALKDCNAGQATIEKLNRNREIDRMRKDGTYDQMFPSGKGKVGVTGPKKPEPTGRQPTPLQILNSKLFPEESE